MQRAAPSALLESQQTSQWYDGKVEYVGFRVSRLMLVCFVPQHNTGQTMSLLCGTEENSSVH